MREAYQCCRIITANRNCTVHSSKGCFLLTSLGLCEIKNSQLQLWFRISGKPAIYLNNFHLWIHLLVKHIGVVQTKPETQGLLSAYNFQLFLEVFTLNNFNQWLELLFQLLALLCWQDKPQPHVGTFNLHGLLQLPDHFQGLLDKKKSIYTPAQKPAPRSKSWTSSPASEPSLSAGHCHSAAGRLPSCSFDRLTRKGRVLVVTTLNT